MSEPSEIRLVRCPKCGNVLPELKDYSVYQCGGCGALLRGKTEIVEADTLSHKSDEERVQGGSDKFPEKLKIYSFPEGMNQSDGSENGIKSNSSYSGTSDKRLVYGSTADNQMNGSSTKVYDLGVGGVDNLEAGMNLCESNRVETGKQFELKPTNGISTGSQKSAKVAEWRSAEGGEIQGFKRNPTRSLHGVRGSTPMYSEDGPSNYNLRSSYGCGEDAKKNNQNKSDEYRKVGYLDQDRAELVRKLDELKDQLSRSCDVRDKPNEKFPLDRRWIHPEEQPYGGFESQHPDSSWGSNRRPYYGSHYPEPSPFMTRQETEMHILHPSVHAPIQGQRFGDRLRSQGHRRGPYQPPGALQQQLSHSYFPEQYTDTEVDSFESYPAITNFHHPSCSCFQCYSQQEVPAPFAPAGFHNRMLPNAQNNLMLFHHETPRAFSPRNHNHKTGHPPPLNSNKHQYLARWPSNHSSEAAGFVCRRPPRLLLATHRRRCHSIAGGAPFVTCNNCLELLQLPKKILLMDINEKKVRCGGCSTIILFSIIDKRLVSVYTDSDRTPKFVDDRPNATVNCGTSPSRRHAKQARTTLSSDDYDDSGYDFEVMDREVIFSSTGKRFSSSKSGEMGHTHSTSPYSSEDEGKIDTMFAKVEESNCVEPVAESNLSPPVAGSPLEYHLEYSNRFHLGNRFGNGSQHRRSEMGKVEDPKKVILLQSSTEVVSLATEMDVSVNEYSNTGTSQESGDISREDQLRANGGDQSFFAGSSKSSFKDSSNPSLSIEHSSTHVTINGHVMSDHLLKKAEKLSGPIHPGHFWYDSRAGFWGVMGGPCLGIIPPFIEEFDYPMPENCAGGNTGVFVNGRELHEKDLNLLSTRGLPTTRDRSYIIEISGRVLDGDSGEELERLGKLAPTIEKVKHGFGMKVPRLAA